MRPASERLQAPEALLQPGSRLGLLVVSARPGLGQSVQQRLNQIAPSAYHVHQVETRERLESTLGGMHSGSWAACLIDLACLVFPHLPDDYASALTRLPRPIALLDAPRVSPSAVRDLVRKGFLAALPVIIDGWSLWNVLACHLQTPESSGNQIDQGTGARVLCPMCQAIWPAFARFCGDCGARLPTSVSSEVRGVATRGTM